MCIEFVSKLSRRSVSPSTEHKSKCKVTYKPSYYDVDRLGVPNHRPVKWREPADCGSSISPDSSASPDDSPDDSISRDDTVVGNGSASRPPTTTHSPIRHRARKRTAVATAPDDGSPEQDSSSVLVEHCTGRQLKIHVEVNLGRSRPEQLSRPEGRRPSPGR